MSVNQVSPAVTRRSYVSLAAFNEVLMNYSYNYNNQLQREVGALTVNPAATAANCPRGRILHETGKKLSPAGGNFGGANDGVSVYMVGVYDPQSGLSGFIDPNSPKFGLQSTDKPIYLTESLLAPENLGNGILTDGTVEAAKFRTRTVGSGTAAVDASAGSATFGANGVCVVNTTAVTPTSMVFITVNNASSINATSAVPANGSFTARSSNAADRSTFYWLVIN